MQYHSFISYLSLSTAIHYVTYEYDWAVPTYAREAEPVFLTGVQ